MIDVRLFLGTYNDFSHVANEIEVKSAVSESHESSFGLIEQSVLRLEGHEIELRQC